MLFISLTMKPNSLTLGFKDGQGLIRTPLDLWYSWFYKAKEVVQISPLLSLSERGMCWESWGLGVVTGTGDVWWHELTTREKGQWHRGRGELSESDVKPSSQLSQADDVCLMAFTDVNIPEKLFLTISPRLSNLVKCHRAT